MKKLMIYIPSYNRYEKLKLQVDRLVATIEKHRIANIEIFINDNASTQPEYLNLKNIYEGFSYIRINRNQNNIGMIGNIIKGFEVNELDFIWILSDDDFVDMTFLPVISHEVAECDMDMFYLKANIKGDNKVHNGQMITSLDEYLELFSTLSMMGLISVNIYSKKIIKYMEYMYLFGNTMFPHVAGMLKMMHEEPIKVKCLGDNVVLWTPSDRANVSNINYAIINFLALGELMSVKQERRLKKSFLKDFGLSHYAKVVVHEKRFQQKAISQVGVIRLLYLISFYLLKTFIKRVVIKK